MCIWGSTYIYVAAVLRFLDDICTRRPDLQYRSASSPEVGKKLGSSSSAAAWVYWNGKSNTDVNTTAYDCLRQ